MKKEIAENTQKQFLDSKRSQLTIFIIIAIILVAGILIYFMFPRIKRVFVPSKPALQLEGCVEDELEEAIDMVSANGGSIEPANGYLYDGVKREYLCYTNKYYEKCVMQRPLLAPHVEKEILDYIKPKARQCIDSLKEDLKKRGYTVRGTGDEISVELMPDYVGVSFSGFNIEKGTEKERYENFEVRAKTNLYRLLMLSTSILNWEARYGDSDITGYMIYYPGVKVEKYKQSEGSKIYRLSSGEDEFVFATRSLSWPPGYALGEK